jgi:hypothetical protein
MKKLTLLLVVTLFSVKYFELTDSTTNLYLNPVSFLGLIITLWFTLGTYKLAKKLITKIKSN